MKKRILSKLCACSIILGSIALASCGSSSNDIYQSYCENAGNFVMAGKGDLGPTPAETLFHKDYTWEAHATGKAMFADFSGTWSVESGELKMTLLDMNGFERNEPVEIDGTTDSRVWSWTFSHPDDRGTGLKYHKNHMSKYDFLVAYNEAFGANETLPEQPTFKITFDNGIWQSGFMGDSKVGELTGDMSEYNVEKHVGDTITLPECKFTRDGYTFSNYVVTDGAKTELMPGDTYVIRDWDMQIRSNFVANA